MQAVRFKTWEVVNMAGPTSVTAGSWSCMRFTADRASSCKPPSPRLDRGMLRGKAVQSLTETGPNPADRRMLRGRPQPNNRHMSHGRPQPKDRRMSHGRPQPKDACHMAGHSQKTDACHMAGHSQKTDACHMAGHSQITGTCHTAMLGLTV